MKRVFAPTLVAVASLSAIAFAAPPRVKADVVPEVVAPGQDFQVHIEATSDEAGGVTSVSMPTPAGFRKSGERTTTTSQMVISGGSVERRQGLSVVYTFSGSKLGTVKLGPIQVEAGGQRYQAPGPRVEISKSAPPPQQQQNDPFAGLFGNLGGGFSFDQDPFFNPRPPAPAAADPALSLAKARGDVLFFHAKATPSDVYFGQRLAFDVLEYIEEGVRAPDFADVHEAKVDDFLSKALEVRRDPRTLGAAEVEGKRYTVKLFRRYQLTPIKTGTLEIGALIGEVPTRSGKNAKRESETLRVIVREPPASGRPNGYALGSVGPYTIAVDPLPASMTTGERAALVIRVTGSGALPSKLQFADFHGALHLADPEISDRDEDNALPGVDDPDPTLLTSTRTFKYLIEARAPGRLDLGEVRLPTYLPNERRYSVVSARLGAIEIGGVAKEVDQDQGAADARVTLDLGAPVAQLGGAKAKASTLPTLAYTGPLLLPLLGWAIEWARKRASRERAPRALDVRERLDAALAREELPAVCTLLVEHVTGARRDREEWPVALADAGKSSTEISEFMAFVDAVDEARYAGSAGEDLNARARRWCERW